MSFDAIAPCYRILEWIAFGDGLQRCRIACLGEIAGLQRALILGEGNGRFLSALLKLHPGIEVDCVDASQRMLQLARKRVEDEVGCGAGRVRFLHRDITSWSPPERHYDLVVTHFVLDCFLADTQAEVIKTLAHAATGDAVWLLAEFRVPERGMKRFSARAWLATMYLFFRIAARIEASELVDPTPLIKSEGFTLVRQHLFRNGILKSEVWRRNL